MYAKKYTGTLKERYKQAHEAFKAKFTSDEWRDYCTITQTKYKNKYKAPVLSDEQKKFLEKTDRRDKFKQNPKRELWMRAKKRAGEQNIEFTITPDDYEIPNKCPLLEIPIIISYTVEPEHRNRDNSPSLDRIDHSKGYIKGNVAVISFKANRAKGPLSIDEMNTLFQNWPLYMRQHVA